MLTGPIFIDGAEPGDAVDVLYRQPEGLVDRLRRDYQAVQRREQRAGGAFGLVGADGQAPALGDEIAQDGADAKGGPAADAAAPPRGPMQACQPDVKKLCQGVQPGGGRLVKCLLDKQSALSDACYDALSDMKNKRQGQDAGARSAPAR